MLESDPVDSSVNRVPEGTMVEKRNATVVVFLMPGCGLDGLSTELTRGFEYAMYELNRNKAVGASVIRLNTAQQKKRI